MHYSFIRGEHQSTNMDEGITVEFASIKNWCGEEYLTS